MEEERRIEGEELQQEGQPTNIPSMDEVLGGMQIGGDAENPPINPDPTLAVGANGIPEHTQQIPGQDAKNSGNQGQAIGIYDLIIILGLTIFFFVVYSVYYFFNGDTLYQIVGILILIFLYKILFFSKRQINTISALLILFLITLVLYTTVNTINFWFFTLSATLITVGIIFSGLYNGLNCDFNFGNKENQQPEPTIPDTQPEINEEPEEDKIQLGDDLVSQYEEEFTQDVEENVTNTLADRIIALLGKGYDILFSPNTRKFLEFYYIISKEEIIYPSGLVEGFGSPVEETKDTTNFNEEEDFNDTSEDNEEEGEWEDEDDNNDSNDEWEEDDDDDDDDFDF